MSNPNALNLDSIQQKAFINYFNTLPEKPPTTVRIFDRNEYYTVHGTDATTAAKEVFSTISNIKKMGVEPNRLDYLVLSKGNFLKFIKKILLVRRYRVEIYTAEGSLKANDWTLQYKASPGNLYQLEEILGEDLDATDDNEPCIMAVTIRTDNVTKGRLLGVACVTAADYQMSVIEFTDDELLTHLETITVQMAPSECLVLPTGTQDYKALTKVLERSNITITKMKKSDFSTESVIQDLNELLKFEENQREDANTFTETSKETAMCSLAAIIKYTSLLSEPTNSKRFRISTIQSECYLHLDASALRALNVFPRSGDTSRVRSRSLFGLLDHTRTAYGKRLLAQWLRQPLHDVNLINERLDIVQLLMGNTALRMQLHQDQLRRLPDLHGLARRITRLKANLHDCYKIYQAIKRLPSLYHCLSDVNNPTMNSLFVEPIHTLIEDLSNFQNMVEATVNMDAVDRGEFLVNPKFDEQLQVYSDQLNFLQNRAEKELTSVARELGLEAGKSIKLETNPQNGYYFKVTLKEEQNLRGNKKYTILQAVKSGVRFQTTRLEDVASEYLNTRATFEKEQDKIVEQIVSTAAGYSECLFSLCHVLSRLDVLVSFAMASANAPVPYCRPVFTQDNDQLLFEQLRHPCLEVQEGVSYIPNDVVFKRGTCTMHVVTGANMGGKSTWMRSCGVAALLAHAGCFVPAAKARLPPLGALLVRAGAHDREQHAQSTFIVEMIDVAAILKMAKPDSLVIIDELGRGTSTYDGCGIAWAVAEELAARECFCLFATHYHELTRLADLHAGRIVNSHAQASVVDGQLVLLHKVGPGPATHSLGLHIARLANLPESVIQYAEAVQKQLEA